MALIKDYLGRDVVVYTEEDNYQVFCEKITAAICKCFDIPVDLLKDAEWPNPYYFGFISPVNKPKMQPKTSSIINVIESYIDIFVSDDQEIIYKFTEDKKANSNGACHEHCDLYYFLECDDIKTKGGISANEICKDGGYFKEV